MPQRSAEETAKISKGTANAHRVRMLVELAARPGQSVSELADRLNINFRTASEHTKKLVAAGLVAKHYQGQSVEHELSPLGRKVLRLLRSI
jgi:DNA-binding transcriptional ArsR family regulator